MTERVDVYRLVVRGEGDPNRGDRIREVARELRKMVAVDPSYWWPVAEYGPEISAACGVEPDTVRRTLKAMADAGQVEVRRVSNRLQFRGAASSREARTPLPLTPPGT